MNFLLTVPDFLTGVYNFAGEVMGSVIDIEDSAVPETAAAHCNIHWSILCIIAIYGIYAILRATYIKHALWSDETAPENPVVIARKSKRYCHVDTVIGIITLAIICLSKYYWTCSVDYKVAAAGALIVIVITIMMEIQNHKLYSRETC